MLLLGLSLAAQAATQTMPPHRSEVAWSAALRARVRLERELPGTHTRAEYEQVLRGFRAIYHGDAEDLYAARAVKQVAELLAEEGREFGDRELLHAAAEQYEFLAHNYPSPRGETSSPAALEQALLLLGPQWAADRAESAGVRSELLRDYPQSQAARTARELSSVERSSPRAIGQAAVVPIVRVPAEPPASRRWTSGDRVSAAAGRGSELPPMPPTDGSAEFGGGLASTPPAAAPTRSSSTRSAATPSHIAATSSHIAATSSHTATTSSHIAATSSHIAATSSHIAATSSHTPAARVAAAPAEPAAPTADGATSMMRVLGLKVSRIVIDAGHGGHDSGTLGVGGIEEKDVVLDVALRLGRLLHDRLGAEIVYTRSDDTFVPLEERTAIANRAQADLFLSVHANSSPDAAARGVEVYYLNFTSDTDAMNVAARENAVSTESAHELSDLVKKIALKDKIDESRELAADVDQSLYAGLERGNPGLRDRGVKKAPFVVLIGARMPSILAEISFVTNPQDAAQLGTEAYRERVAESLYRGVAKYAAGLNGSRPQPTERLAEAR